MQVRIYRRALIHTGVAGQQPAEALAVADGEVLAVGSATSVRDAARAATDGPVEEVDLEEAVVLPGFYDAHIHTANLARELVSVDLRSARTLSEALALVADHAATLTPGAWLTGGRWNHNLWAPPVQPDRWALDSVTGSRPAALASVDGHTTWVNSRALALAGIDRSTPDPVGGEIARDRDGEPTGILRETAAALLDPVLPPVEGLPALLRRAQDHLLSLGLTSVHDLDGEDCREAYLRLKADGDLHIRVHKGIRVAALDQAIAEGRRTGAGDDWFRTGPVKLFSDGALGSRTCHMSHDFAGEAGNHGIAVTPFEDLRDQGLRANAAGLAAAGHAIGDRANELVLDAFAAALEQRPAGGASGHRHPVGLRNRIEHAQHLRPEDVQRMARLGAVASMQPTHCTTDFDLADQLLGGRELASYAWRSMLNAGVPLAFGSDAPVEDANPFHALHAAMTRTRPDGTPAGGWQPEQRLSAAEALTAHTLGAAWAAGEDHRKGVLAPGRLADFVVVDTDPHLAPPEVVRDTTVLTTVVGGVVRWQHDSSNQPVRA